jgi:shikimate kinase
MPADSHVPPTPVRSTSRDERIVLVGFMAAGKSTVGRALAARLGWDFVDTDALVEARENRTIEAMFRTDGEGYFREREWEALQQALSRTNVVIATGGGLYLAETHQAAIRERALAVWLDAPFSSIWERCRAATERPLVGTREALEQLYLARRGRYERADLRVVTGDRDAADIAAEIDRKRRSLPANAGKDGTE